MSKSTTGQHVLLLLLLLLSAPLFGQTPTPVTVPVVLTVTLPAALPSVTNVTNVYPVTVITNKTLMTVIAKPVIDPLVGARLFLVAYGPLTLSVTNFTNDRLATLYLANPNLWPITWPAGRWRNNVKPSPTNDFPIVLFESINGVLIATE